jgi:hypothetical protein
VERDTLVSGAAAKRVRGFVAEHGAPKISILAGGTFGALGTLVPFAHVSSLFGGGESYSIIQAGFYGVLALAVAIALAACPFAIRLRRLRLAAFGLSSAMFGIFFAIWLASSGLVGLFGGTAAGLSAGFYISLIGYAALVGGYFVLVQPATNALDA